MKAPALAQMNLIAMLHRSAVAPRAGVASALRFGAPSARTLSSFAGASFRPVPVVEAACNATTRTFILASRLRIASPGFGLKRTFTSASSQTKPRNASLGLLGAVAGVTLAALILQQSLEAKSLLATAREMSMLTRLNDIDALNRLFPLPKEASADGSTALAETTFDPNVRHPLGWAPLHVAAANNNLRLVEFWLNRGADIDLVDEYQGPSGGRGSMNSFESIFEMISTRQKEFSAYLDPRAAFAGFTALHYACLTGNKPIIELLLSRGADPTKQDHEGRTPRDYLDDESSGINDHGEVTKLFEEAEKKFSEEKRRREREQRRNYPLEGQLKERIIGQETPINSGEFPFS